VFKASWVKLHHYYFLIRIIWVKFDFNVHTQQNYSKKNYLPFFMSINLTAQLNRIEPPFWYAGMQNPELQILFYGELSLPTLLLLQMQFLSQTLNDRKPNYIFVTVNTKDIPHLSLFFIFKIKIIFFYSKNIL
jgi:hypothetical protein